MTKEELLKALREEKSYQESRDLLSEDTIDILIHRGLSEFLENLIDRLIMSDDTERTTCPDCGTDRCWRSDRPMSAREPEARPGRLERPNINRPMDDFPPDVSTTDQPLPDTET